MTRPPCAHHWRDGSTLLLTYSQHHRCWSACCTSCRQWTGFLSTREEARRRAERGEWCK